MINTFFSLLTYPHRGSPQKKLPKCSNKFYNSLLSALKLNRDLRFFCEDLHLELPHTVGRLMWFISVLKDRSAPLTVEIYFFLFPIQILLILMVSGGKCGQR